MIRDLAPADPLGAGMPSLEVVGEFTIPPPGALRRDFQPLHIDFGLPIAPAGASDVARYTALWIDPERAATTAVTRIVPLRELLALRTWPAPDLLVERMRAYAEANAGAAAEGILARLVEAADDSPTLPRAANGFLCGMEFDTVAQERAHLSARGLDLDAAEQRVQLGPGELLVFDNLAVAHGRLGVREPLELNQLCVGYRGLGSADQSELARRALAAWT